MAITVLTAATRRTASKLSVLSGSLRPAKALKVMSGGQLRVVATFGPVVGPFNVTAQPNYAYGEANSNKPTRVTSASTTATVSGGVGPYTYSWSADDGGFSVDYPRLATTTFSALMTPGRRFGTATCIATDSYGATAACTVTVDLNNDGGF